MSLRFSLAFILLLLALPLAAKDLYVATTGNDAVTYDGNSLATPWASPRRAWEMARAGDTVYFRGGTYLITQKIDTKYMGDLGRADAPIRFTHYANEDVVLQGVDISGGMLFCIEKPYNWFDGLTIRANFIGSGVLIQFGYDLLQVDHGKVTRCTLELIGATHHDNAACVKFYADSANYGEVSHCRIIGDGQNSGVQMFRVLGTKVLNNEITNCRYGVFLKHSNALDSSTGNINHVSNNYFHDMAQEGIFGVFNYAQIENNLLVNCGITLGNDAGAGNGYIGADYNTIRSNTLVNKTLQFVYEGGLPAADPNRGCLHNTVHNNILMDMSRWHRYTAPVDTNGVPIPNYDYDVRSDYNLYPDLPTILNENDVNYSLAAWRAYNLSQHGRVVDANSRLGTPIFLGGASPSSLAGFALAAGSPGKGVGLGGRDMGADVSRVGIQPLTSLTITSPNGGESWRRGESRPITWTATGVSEPLVIELMQGPTLLGVLASGVAPTPGAFAWTVGRLADGTFRTGPNVKIRIRTASGQVMAEAQWSAK